MSSISLSTTFLVLVLPLVASTQAGNVYKCKQADGSVTFSNVSCPEDTVDREYKGEHRERQAWEDDAQNYYSATRQMQRAEQKNAAEQYERDMKRQRAAINKANRNAQRNYDQAGRVSPEAVRPTMTYEQAQKSALKETGYRNYGNLTSLQKDRVNKKMLEHGHLPRNKPSGVYQQAISEAERQNEALDRNQQIRQKYKSEKFLKEEMGIWSGEARYNRGVKDCKQNPEANCW